MKVQDLLRGFGLSTAKLLLRGGAPTLGLVLCTLGLSLSARSQEGSGTIITFQPPGSGGLRFPTASTRRARSRDSSRTKTPMSTDSCAPPTAPLQPSMCRAPWTPTRAASTRSAPSRETTKSHRPPARSCGLRMASSPRLISRARRAHLARVSTRRGRSRGFNEDASFTEHGFVRTSGGAITAFDPTGSRNTYAASINLVGAIVGQYLDANNVSHGFLAECGRRDRGD